MGQYTRLACNFLITMFLLTEWEGRMGKYLARGHDCTDRAHKIGQNSVRSGLILSKYFVKSSHFR